MQNLYKELEALLSKDSTLHEDWKLLKNKVIALSLSLDPKLIALLLKAENLKNHFFQEIDGVFVFDKVKFQRFVSNKSFLPDSYTSYKNQIGLWIGEDYLADSKEVSLVWAYKDCVLEGGQDQEDAKRREVFHNEILAPDQIDRLLAPKVLTNWKKYDKDWKQKATSVSIDDNLIIKGNNLLALYSLLPIYAGKIKLIYIDPPYNTGWNGDTFAYNNAFKHSTWLTFMKNRLEVAKKLLTPDWCLIVAIDKAEQAYLWVLLDEIFKEHESHCITIVHNPRGVQGTNFSYTNEFAFFVIPKWKKSIWNRKIEEGDIDFSNLRNWWGESERDTAKNCFYPVIVKNGEIIWFWDVLENSVHPKQTEKIGDEFLVYPIDTKWVERKWRYARQTVDEVKSLLRAKKTKSWYEIEIWKDFWQYKTVWVDERYDANEYGTKLIKELVPWCQFSFPKSLWNVYDCLHAVVKDDKNAIVLDFFGWSGTTGHAVIELNKQDKGNRKFILVDQMHDVEGVTSARMQAVIKNEGKGSFVYAELSKLNENFVERIEEAKKTKDLENIWWDMREKAFLSYRIDPKSIDIQAREFQDLSLEDQKRFLFEVLDKNMLYIPYSEISDKSFDVSDEDKKLNTQFYAQK